MPLFHQIKLIFHILKWRFTWSRHNLDYQDPSLTLEKFITARQAAVLISDGSCVFSNGIAGNARCSLFFYALRDRFLKTGHPKDLTWINSGAQGSRGRVPGTIEEIGLPGLMKRYLAGHLETAKAQLKLAQEGLLNVHTLPQGVISLLLVEQAKGSRQLKSAVGLQSFLDPRVGHGSVIFEREHIQFVKFGGDSLVYSMPKIDITLFNAPYADRYGNIYFKNAATISENLQSVEAAKKNGGLVMVAVSQIIPVDEQNISVPSEQVDYIIIDPFLEQTVSVKQRKYWKIFTPQCDIDFRSAARQLKFINNFLRITPVRKKMGELMSRLASLLFIKLTPKNGLVNIGVGFPEEVARILVENGREKDYIFTTEAGAYGGLPAPGIFFGAAVHPDHLEPSSSMFERYYKHLDMAVLGFLEVDAQGNVNVSNRGPAITDYVGPGGFSDIVYSARKIIFVGSFMHRAKFGIKDFEIKLLKPGKSKFVKQVREITFSGKEALRQNKSVYFVSDVGIFRLVKSGLELVACFRGIEIEKDILDNSEAKIQIPDFRKIQRLDPSIQSLEGISLKIPVDQYVFKAGNEILY